jgi:hypothetical protein
MGNPHHTNEILGKIMAGKEEKEEDIVVVEDQGSEEGSSGDIDSSKEEEKDKRKSVARKRGNDSQKRMNELWMKAKKAEDSAAQNANVAANERHKNSEYEKITAAALEENINTKRELLTERLIRAQESGDAKKSSELTAELSRIEAQAAQIERYKLENQVNSGQQKQQPRQQQQQVDDQVHSADDMYERMSPAGKKWLDENRDWYDASGDNHDPEMSGDVTYYAQTLESELRTSGRGAEIGTRGYFKKIDDYIKQNWSDDTVEKQGNDEEESPPATQKKSYATPVGNRNNATATPPRKEYKITQAEKELALSLDTKDRSGKPLSDNDKIKRFITNRERTPASGPISMSTLKGA